MAAGLEFPPTAALRANVFLRYVGVNRHARTIPGELLSHPTRDVAQEQGLGDKPLEFEIPARPYLASFAGIEPFPLVAGRARQRLRRLLVAVHFCLRNELGTAAIKRTENFSAVSDEEQAFIFFAVAFEGTVLFHFLGARRLQTAVVPSEFHLGHVTPGGEVVVN